MISVAEAKKIITSAYRSPESAEVDLLQAVGSILAQDLYAPISLPSFAQSSVDGYALAWGSPCLPSYLLLKGESAAGTSSGHILRAGQALRVFTGAPLPEGTMAVVMQEQVELEHDRIYIDPAILREGMHIRLPGSDIERNALVLEKGTIITPAVTGVLAALGISQVSVYRPPVVTLIITGNELQPMGSPLPEGKVYESNSWMLKAALRQCGVCRTETVFIEDDLAATSHALEEAMKCSDLVILSGGMSVGDHDHGREAMRLAGVSEKLYRVKQRPGKPFCFGVREKTAVFGLPGNPSSALTLFYIYIAPYISAMQGLPCPVVQCRARVQTAVSKPAHLTCFLKGSFRNGTAESLAGQESYKMKTFAQANCLIEIPESVSICQAGTEVNIYLLPNHP